MKFFNVVPLALMAVVVPIIAADIDQRYLEAYEDPHCTGPAEIFYDYAPDLSDYLIDNAIRSIRITGTWVLYDDYNYVESEYSYDNARELYYGINSCFDLSSALLQKVSSLRYAGSPFGLSDIYFNVYQHPYYGGREFGSNTDSPSLGEVDGYVSSLIITGQSPWTFYTGVQYTGEAVCVYPEVNLENDDVEYIINYFDFITELGVPDQAFRSVATGCLSERVVRLSPSKAAPGPDSSHEMNDIVH